MVERRPTMPLPSVGPPVLPPRRRVPPPLPPRRQATVPVSVAVEQRETTERLAYLQPSCEASSVDVSADELTHASVQSITGESISAEQITTQVAAFEIAGPSLPNPGASIPTITTQCSPSSQTG